MTDVIDAGKAGFAPPPPTMPDALRMGSEFSDPPKPPDSPKTDAPPNPPTEYVREIDLGDGTGKQRFIGKTYEELVDKLVVAQENASRRINELKAKKPVEPEREVKPAFELKPPTEAEILALKEGFDADPVAAWKKSFEIFTGQTPEQYQTERSQYAADQQRKQAEVAFLKAHKDFNNCPENAAKISDFLAKEQLPVTKRNLEYAYQNLEESFVKVQAQPVAPPPPPVPTVRDIPPPPVSISARFGDRPMDTTGIEGVDAAEFAKIATLPAAEMKARIEQLFRKQRG